MTASSILGFLNYETVLIFGVIISVTFAGVEWNRKNKLGVFIFCVVASSMQLILYFLFDKNVTSKFYPLFTHFPLILFITYYCKRPFIMSFSAVMAAYLCCQTRRWIGSFFLYIFDNESLWYTVQVIVTAPLLYLLIRYASKPVYNLIKQSRRSQIYFGLIPFFYYVFDYTTTVYSDLLYSGSRVAVEFMPSVMSIGFFAFVLLIAAEIQRNSRIKEEQRFLEMQITESTKELSSLRQSQTQAAIYRHDLRHHLRYLDHCIRDNKTDEALSYIQTISETIEASQLVRYCENETINLILSSYAATSSELGIRFDANVNLASDDLNNVSAVDLCVIIGNVLENAINACKVFSGEKYILVETRKKNGKVFWLVCNPYDGEVHFEGNLPITSDTGHGIGIKSVLMTVEKLSGLCEFTAGDGIFTVRLMV